MSEAPPEVYMSLFECYANISTADPSVISRLSSSIEKGGSWLLDVDPGKSAGRTVLTFAGNKQQLKSSIFNLTQSSIEAIDMNKWSGNHPCIGSADVLPITPLGGTSIKEGDELAEEIAAELAAKLELPIYCQNLSDLINTRRSLSSLRATGFAGLNTQFQKDEFSPDFGPTSPHPTAGATIIGARNFLVPINFCLNTKDTAPAKKLAEKIRSSGTKKPGGQGLFQHCMALGWYVEEYGCSQVSTNLANFKITPPHLVFEALKELAVDLNVEITGSEVIGLIPEEALQLAAAYYSSSSDTDSSLNEAASILGLDFVKPFSLDTKLIERRFAAVAGKSIS